MFYDFSITVPAGTSSASPVRTELKLTRGIIHQVEVEFYSGARRFVWVKLFHGGHQLFPTNPDGSFRSDGYTIRFADYYELRSDTNVLTVLAYGDSPDYAHTVTIRIGVLENQTELFLLKVIGGMQKLLELVGIKL